MDQESEPRRPEPETGQEPDASEVVSGPIGDAHLVDPTDAEPLSADLEALPAIDDKEPPDDKPVEAEQGV